MKCLLVSLSFLSVLSFSVISYAAPVTYQFTANGEGVVRSDNAALLALVAGDVENYEFSGGVEAVVNLGVNGLFIYDNAFNTPSVPPIGTTLPSPVYGVRYANVISGFTGSAFGISFDAAGEGQVLVYNDAPSSNNPFLKQDLVTAGAYDVSNFSIGGFVLERVDFVWFALNSPTVPNPALISSAALPLSPLDLSNALPLYPFDNTNPAIRLTFANGGNRYVLSYTGVEISEVPVPAALPLMMSAVAGLFGLNRFRKK